MRPPAVRLSWILLACAGAACGDVTSDVSPGSTPAAFTILGRWPAEPDARPLELTYRVEGGDGQGRLGPALRSALEVWDASGVVRLRLAREGMDADVSFSFASGAHGSCTPFGRDSTLAHAGPSAPPSFVHFDRGREWSDDEAGPSLVSTAAHELGHVLGLGHSSDPEALMFAAPGKRRLDLGSSDHAALQSLYGGGDDGPGDLEVRGKTVVLRRVAPRELTDVGVLDTDGDGDQELLVWRTDEPGYGTLMIYHFAAGPRLSRTVGPLPGVALPGVPHLLGVAANGERLFVSLLDDGRWLARSFDKAGLPRSRGPGPLRLGAWLDEDGDGSWDDSPAAGAERVDTWTADLDGDGSSEQLTRR